MNQSVFLKLQQAIQDHLVSSLSAKAGVAIAVASAVAISLPRIHGSVESMKEDFRVAAIEMHREEVASLNAGNDQVSVDIPDIPEPGGFHWPAAARPR